MNAPAFAVRPRVDTDSSTVREPPGYVQSDRARGERREKDASSIAGDSTSRVTSTSHAHDAAIELQRSKLRVRRAFAYAQSSVSSVGMMGFMMWMSGSSVQVFSIMVVFGGVAQTTRAILGSKATFEAFRDGDERANVAPARMMFVLVQLAGLLLALRKLNTMGLLPSHASDWVGGWKPPRSLERAFGGIELEF